VIRNIIGKNTKLMGVVKANAYGHGLVEISKELEKLNVDYLGTAYLEEAIYLRENGIKKPILVLGAITNSQVPLYLKYDVDMTGSSIEKIENISKVAKKLGKCANIHLKIDTGMGRIGVQWDRKEKFIDKAYSLENINIVGIFSHFSDSINDKIYTYLQSERFSKVLEYIKKNYKLPPIIHLANSGAVSNNYKDSFFDMARPGLMLYGYSFNPKIQRLLKPVMKFFTKVSYFKVLEKGYTVGYDRTYTTENRSRIITLPVGYADGYPSTLSNKGYVYVNDKIYPLAGRVCMDQVMVSLGKTGEAYVGDTVELWGDNISLYKLSSLSERSIWDMLTSISERVPRIYKK
jgi:alanine racemase